MDWYEIAKVIHFMGLIALFGFFVINARAGERLRTASTLGEVRTWLDMMDATRGMLPGAAVLFTLSGIAMASLRWRRGRSSARDISARSAPRPVMEKAPSRQPSRARSSIPRSGERWAR